MVGNKFSATAPALGYLYQVRYALFILLSAEHDEIELSIEQLDDVAFEQDGNATELLQLKHHIENKAKLTNFSPEFWTTIRVWSEHIKANGILKNTVLSLVTTAQVSEDETTFVKHLRPGVGRDTKFISSEMLSIAQHKGNKKLEKAFIQFIELTDTERESLVNSIQILDSSPNIIDTSDKIKQKLLVRSQHKEAVYARLEGWWFDKVIRHLKSGEGNKISKYELNEQIIDIAEQFRPDALPIDFLSSEPPDKPDPDKDQRRFVIQLKAIALQNKQIELAIRDYYRAFEQRSRWQREKLVNLNELEKYENRLREEVEREREWYKYDSDNEDSMKWHGQQLYRWAEQADLRIRPQVTAPYVMRGSFHILANLDTPKIAWHPKFIERLQELVDLPKPASDWEDKPREIANLFNPAFSARLLRETIKDYQKASKHDMPFALLFLILPIILHKPTRESLPRDTRTKLHVWIRANPKVRIGFGQRTQDMMKITREGLFFGLDNDAINISEDGNLIATKQKMKVIKESELDELRQTEINEIERRAKFLGRWFAQNKSVSTIFIMWGIRP